ncbi:MAG: BspA family leucine-rich repeat surface protein [Bacteroidota bacterium]
MKKIRFSILMMLSVGMFIVSCSSDENGTTPPTDDDGTTPPTTIKKPTISGFTPTSGPVGIQVTINGTNFSATAASNTVKIGSTTATVSAATITKLTISVPQGASTGAVSVAVGGETATGNTFTVTEAEAQNTAPVITNQTTTAEVDEDVDGDFTIFTVTATDADADDTLVFEITGGNSEGLFNIDENGQVTLADGKNLDYEAATQHSITVTVSDGNGGTDQISIQIAVLKVEDLLNDPASFIFTLETVDANEEFSIEVFGEGEEINFQIDWGDGQPEEDVTVQGNLVHEYQDPGTYTVALKGQVGRITFIGQAALRTVEQWGTTEWKSMENLFLLEYLLDDDVIVAIKATDKPNLAKCTSLENAFLDADFQQDINGWDVNNITNMHRTFAFNPGFNQDISDWNVSNVETMYGMFFKATAFDQNLGGWQIGNVTDMTNMLKESGMSTINFSNTLIGWANQDVQPNVPLDADGIFLCIGAATGAYTTLTDAFGSNWNIDYAGNIPCN